MSMSFLDTLPAVLASMDQRITCRETVGNDQVSQGWIINLPNDWYISLADIGNTCNMSIMAFPRIRHGLAYNFNPVFDPEDIRDCPSTLQPHEILRYIRLIMELPPEIPSDHPDEDDLLDTGDYSV